MGLKNPYHGQDTRKSNATDMVRREASKAAKSQGGTVPDTQAPYSRPAGDAKDITGSFHEQRDEGGMGGYWYDYPPRDGHFYDDMD